MKTDLSFLDEPSSVVAERLLGCLLERKLGNNILLARIVETEAYDQSDAASHSYKGRTPRTDIMFGPPGYLYVYFTYGMHYCCNVVTGAEGSGAAVLIRAAEPLGGIELMEKNRKKSVDLTNGPAKLCQAFLIDKSLNGHDLKKEPLRLIIRPRISKQQIIQTTRIGISRNKEIPWRYYIKNNPFVSKR